MRRALPLVVALLIGTATAARAGEIEIVDAEGGPVAGARLEVWAVPASGSVLERLDPVVAAGESGADGALALGPLPRARDLTLIVDHPGFAPMVVETRAPLPPRLVLAPGRRLSGRVVFPGSPSPPGPPGPGDDYALAASPVSRPRALALEGRACATWTTQLGGFGRSHKWRRCAPIAAGGRFEIAGLEAAATELRVEVPGFLPATRAVAPTADPVVVALEPGVRLHGKVTDPGGRPIAGATVRAGADLAAESDDAGAFLLTVRALPVVLTAEAAGYRTAGARVGRAEHGAGIVIALDPGQILTGVLLGDDGAPIAGAVFWAHRHLGGTRWTTERHEMDLADGVFRLSLSDPGLVRVRIQAAGYREAALPEVAIGPGEEIALGAVVLARGGRVLGTLVDELTGEAVAGATVTLMPRGEQLIQQALRGSLARAISDEEGAFEIVGVESGSYDLGVELAGYAPELREVDLAQDALEDLGTLELGRGVEIAGAVVDRAGRGRPGLEVSFYQGAGEAWTPLAVRRTGAQGELSGLTLSPGSYQVRVRGERLLLSQAVEIAEGAERQEIELVAGGISLVGVVTRDGTPVAGGFLTLTAELDPGLRRGVVLLNTGGALDSSQSRFNTAESELMAEVGADGMFHVEDVPAGQLRARYYGLDGGEAMRRLAVPDQAEARVVVEIGGVDLAGVVRDGTSGDGVPAAVRLFWSSGQPAASAVADAEGRFDLPGQEPGTYRLEAAAPGYAPRVLEDLRVTSGAPPIVVDLEPGATGTLAVALERADGSPLARVLFTVLDAQGTMVRSLLSEWDGTKVFEDLAAGEYVVVWSDSLAGTGASPPLALTPGETTTFRSSVAPASAVVLRCDPSLCGGQGLQQLQVVAPAGVEITPYLAGIHVGMRFSEAGDLVLGRLSPGHYLLRAASGGTMIEALIEVDGGNVVVALR